MSWVTSVMGAPRGFFGIPESACAFAARQLGGQGVQMRAPEAAEAVEPGVYVPQRPGVDRVQPPGSFWADGREPVLPQYLQMLRHTGLRDPELLPDDLAE